MIARDQLDIGRGAGGADRQRLAVRAPLAVVLAAALVLVLAAAAGAYTRSDQGTEKRQDANLRAVRRSARSAASQARSAAATARRVGEKLSAFQGSSGRTVASIVSSGLITQQALGNLSDTVSRLDATVGRLAAQTRERDYGVAALMLGDVSQGVVWTPDIPTDGNNAAQAADEGVVTTPADCGANATSCVLRLRAAIRSNRIPDPDPDPGTGPAAAGQVGGKLVVTEASGALYAAAQTPPNAVSGGRRVVPVQGRSSLASAAPTPAGAGGTDVPLDPDPTLNTLTLAPSTTYVVRSSVQFFAVGEAAVR